MKIGSGPWGRCGHRMVDGHPTSGNILTAKRGKDSPESSLTRLRHSTVGARAGLVCNVTFLVCGSFTFRGSERGDS